MRLTLAVVAGVALCLSSVPAQADDEIMPGHDDTWSVRSESGSAVSDDIIVHWESGVGRAARVQVREEVNTQGFQNLGNSRFQLLTLAEGQDPNEAVRELRGTPGVADVSRDGFSVLHAPAPNDPLFGQLWGLENKGLNIGGVSPSTAGTDISALDAWSKTVGDESVIVADLDDGIRPDHPDLKNRIWTNPAETAGDGIDNDSNGIVDDVIGADFAGADVDAIVFDNDPTDDLFDGGHGTHTAGTIAAQGDNGVGITGVAQKVTIMPLRVCGWSPANNGVLCRRSSQIAAINYAGENGAKVANMSLGGLSSGTGDPAVVAAFAANPEVLFVISAGNDANDNDSATTTFPCAYDPSTSGQPGAVDNIVCVAASNQSDARASFSSWGKTKVDIAAPGTEILSTYVTNEKFDEDYQGAFTFSGWINDNWKLASAAPLVTPGITNDTQTQADGVTRVTRTPQVTVNGPTSCTVTFFRKLTSSAGDLFQYRAVVNGVPQTAVTGNNQNPGIFSLSFDVPAGAQQVATAFSFQKGAGTPASNGVWIDNTRLHCYVPPGQETGTSYEYLQGTSMAAPHVTGAAALLAAYEPSATSMQLKQALLTSVDPVAQFNPATGAFPISSGGRLNADKALTAVDALVAPGTSITSGPSGSTTDTSASFSFNSDSATPVTFECRLDGGGFAPCTSPSTVSGLAVGDHSFEVRAKDQAGTFDATPASAAWTVAAPPQAPPPVEPPAVAPAKVSGVKVKRKKTSAVVSWQSVSGATSYRIRIGTSTKTSAGTSMKLKKLKPGKKYTVTIAAVNASGPGPAVKVKIKKFR
jgi:subtilisin family serine protease